MRNTRHTARTTIRPLMWPITSLLLVALASAPAYAGRLRTPVNLGAASTFAILTKSGITNVPTSAIVGDIGTSPITGAAIGPTC